jgi:hypothetical protein
MSKIILCKVELEEVGVARHTFSGSIAADQGEERVYQLPAAAGDVTIDVTPLSGTFYVKAFMLTADKTITWRLASGDAENTMTASGCVILFNCSLTSLVLKNATSGATATVRIVSWGTA